MKKELPKLKGYNLLIYRAFLEHYGGVWGKKSMFSDIDIFEKTDEFYNKTKSFKSCDPQTSEISNMDVVYAAYKWKVKSTSLGYKKNEVFYADTGLGTQPRHG